MAIFLVSLWHMESPGLAPGAWYLLIMQAEDVLVFDLGGEKEVMRTVLAGTTQVESHIPPETTPFPDS